MQQSTARRLLARCLRDIASGHAGEYLGNPAVQFAKDAENGKFEYLPDADYDALLAECEEVASLWHKKPRRTAGELLVDILEKAGIPGWLIDDIASQIAKRYVRSAPDEIRIGECSAFRDALEFPLEFLSITPSEIRDAISGKVIGQADAVKAAAMTTYGCLAGRRSNAVFCGPSGCGKSEIWRCLSKEFPGLVRIMDFSRMSADGWSGSQHLRDIFNGVDAEDIRRHGLIVVLDEADKILCESAIGAGGTDHNRIVQSMLLKMLDGDVIEFGAQDGKPGLSIDCSKVSVVMLGAFERLLQDKSAGAKRIGFGAPAAADAGTHGDITYDDLIAAGMRLEIAGRINRIVALDPLTIDRYKDILRGPMLSDLERSIGARISVSDAAVRMLSERAMASGLGARWMGSALRNAIDDAMFDAPEAKEYRISARDGRLCCRAKDIREAGQAGSRASAGFQEIAGCLAMAGEIPF